MLFDFLAMVSALFSGWLIYQWRLKPALEQTAASINYGYFIALSLGSILGAYIFGTLNLYLSEIPGLGRSVLGAVCGATFAVELYKYKRGIKRSTGYIYAIPFCVMIAVGRIGCVLSGMDDQTHGLPTTLPWGWDFGDHILRHPVQLYESLAMTVCLIAMVILLRQNIKLFSNYAYYICIGFYGAQRFIWEFLKPYATVYAAINLFQLLCLALVIYSVAMIIKVKHDSSSS